MRILVVGSGGREHALCWAIAASPLCDKLYCAPGNAGIAAEAECVPIGAEAIEELVAFALADALQPLLIFLFDFQHLVLIGAGGAIDMQPCGGTHVRSTGEIGSVAVSKIEKKGKINRRIRVTFV